MDDVRCVCYIIPDNRFLSPTKLAGKQVVARTGLRLSLVGRRWRNAPHGGMRCAFPPYTLYPGLLSSLRDTEQGCAPRTQTCGSDELDFADFFEAAAQ